VQKVKHLLGLSGGKDSAALAVFMRINYPDLDIDYFFTDTGEELPEVYEFLDKLEAFLGKSITKLNPHRNFKFWLRENGHYLPSPRARWCTLNLKLKPFRDWINKFIKEGYLVKNYVAIRFDESERQGYIANNPMIKTAFPFKEHKIDKAGVLEILDSSGVNLPKYYEWRSRSGCTFCFFQQKIEWVRLKEQHPEAFENAKALEKTAKDNQSPFTWIKDESLEEFDNPKRFEQIKADFEKRIQREESIKGKYKNQLHVNLEIDDLMDDEEQNGSCNICHK